MYIINESINFFNHLAAFYHKIYVWVCLYGNIKIKWVCEAFSPRRPGWLYCWP